jgi:streptogramin lyase
MAFDGSGNMWITGQGHIGSTNIYVAENATKGFADGNFPAGVPPVSIDGSGNVWLANVEYVGAATPVVTPIAANLSAPYNAPASRP